MSIAKIYITIRTQVLPGPEAPPDQPVKEVTRRLATGFMTEDMAEGKEALARAVLEAILKDAEFVED